MKRAGADGILTYFAKRAASELKTGSGVSRCKREPQTTILIVSNGYNP